jgi:hypothetical protein
MWDAFSRVFEYLMVAAVLVGLWLWQRRSARRRSDESDPEDRG